MKSILKRKKLLVFVTLVLLFAVLLMTSCNKKKVIEKREWFLQIEKPVELADEDLSIEWVEPLDNKKSVAILFNGYSEYDSKHKLGLPTNVYGSSIFTAKAFEHLAPHRNEENSIYDLAQFWRDAGFSVGIFHYEKFAEELDNDGNFLDFSNKIFDKTKNSFKYQNEEGEIAKKDVNFNLLEAFIDAYNQDVISAGWNFYSYSRPFEIRFIGHKAGANMAVAAADYLYLAYNNKAVDGKYLPNRVSLLNPYLANDIAFDVNVDYKEKSKLKSLLLYNEEIIKNLSDQGVVFEMYQANQKHFLEYNTLYNGVTLIEEDNYQWDEGTDTILYDSIVSNVAYLEFYENITADYFIKDEIGYQKYDRLVLDWYLYSICGGADEKNSNNMLSNGEYPIYDAKNRSDIYTDKSNYLHYGMSAWVSTVYLKIMQGHKYTTSTYVQGTQGNPSSTNLDPMNKFGSSINQIGDFDLRTNGFFVAGYVYEAKDKSKYVNLAPDCAIANATLTIKISLQDNSSNNWYEVVETDSNGLYLLNLPEKMITSASESYYIEFVGISFEQKGYTYFENNDFSDSTSKKIYSLINVNSINKPGSEINKYGLLAIREEAYYAVVIKNCALIKYNSD